jgi:hypothetical protein
MTRAPTIPSDPELDIAIEFLRLNEGDAGEAEACHAVADWLEGATGIRSRRKKSPLTEEELDALPRKDCR